MALARCVFCGREQEDYQGTYLIKNDGTMNYYCSLKCRKNHLKLGRDKRKLKWTRAFHESREKRIEKAKKEHEKVQELAKEDKAKNKDHKHEEKKGK